ncbi:MULTISPECIES: hypothetical protein [unclassified Methylobacterium]|uniref:hypothetical protein n=1 Tax=unclassified Methylobacterium TaxID=2615210 RepID=UPI00034B0BE9|nr:MULTISPECIES: hypothetical protein [unclassified Methylobacterium]
MFDEATVGNSDRASVNRPPARFGPSMTGMVAALNERPRSLSAMNSRPAHAVRTRRGRKVRTTDPRHDPEP